MVLFEILTRYPYIDSSHWLREDVQRIIDNVFREKSVVEKFLTLSSRTFLQNYWFLPVFVVVFIVIRFIVMSCPLPMDDKHPSFPPIEQ